MELSRGRLDDLTIGSVDPASKNPVIDTYKYLSDENLDRLIEKRNMQGKPTRELRYEYDKRLKRKNK